jgi:hypothetical protein
MTDATARTPTTALLNVTPLSGPRHRYVLLLLLGAYTLSFLDRQVVTILAEAIKKDLHISNLELGMLTGLAFAVFYTFLGIPGGAYWRVSALGRMRTSVSRLFSARAQRVLPSTPRRGGAAQ